MFETWKAALGLKGGFYVALVLALVVFILEAVLYSAGFILSGGRRKIMLWSNMGHVAKGVLAHITPVTKVKRGRQILRRTAFYQYKVNGNVYEVKVRLPDVAFAAGTIVYPGMCPEPPRETPVYYQRPGGKALTLLSVKNPKGRWVLFVLPLIVFLSYIVFVMK